MTSGECFENKWFYMKYIAKYLSVEILLTHECIWNAQIISSQKIKQYIFLHWLYMYVCKAVFNKVKMLTRYYISTIHCNIINEL